MQTQIENLALQQAGPVWDDQRACRRHDQSGAVHFNVFNSDQPASTGTLRNFGEHGMYFEAPRFVSPGTPLVIRLAADATPSDASGARPCCKSISLAETRWCQTIGDKENPRFGVGVKFY
jgi:hypothetical protein